MASTDGQGPGPHEGSGGPDDRRRKALAVAAALTAGWLFVMGMLVSYTAALGDPSVNGATVAASGSPELIETLKHVGGIDVDAVDDPNDVRETVANGEAQAGFTGTTTNGAMEVTTFVASGSSVALARTATGVGAAVAQQLAATSATVDVAPPAERNPNGTLEFYLVIFLTIGASVGATIIGRILGPVRSWGQGLANIAVFAVCSILLAGGGVLFAQAVDGIAGDHGLAFFGALWFYTFAVSIAVTGVSAVGGSFAGLAVSLFLVLLGNSASGGPFGTYMQNGFFQAVRWVVPQSWGLELLQHIEYFASNGIAGPLTALGIWLAVGAVGIVGGLLIGHRRSRSLDPTGIVGTDLPSVTGGSTRDTGVDDGDTAVHENADVPAFSSADSSAVNDE